MVRYPFAALAIAVWLVGMAGFCLVYMCLNRATTGRWWT